MVTLVDSDATLVFVVDRPVDSEFTLVEVDVDSEATLLLVVDR
ncbi:tash protein pest motif family, partial [Burkholderia pseudomallei 1026a]